MTEKEYLGTNTKYIIEHTLLNSIPIDELQSFILLFYEEYTRLENNINNKIKEKLCKYDNLDELSKYFIEILVKQESWWERLEELINILNTFNTHLYSRLPSKRKYNKQFRKIDINEISIKEVLWMYIKLPYNLRRNLKCPLHKENTASFKVYESTNSWYCFWCKRGWNSINFISKIENISTKEAYKKFIEYFNL